MGLAGIKGRTKNGAVQNDFALTSNPTTTSIDDSPLSYEEFDDFLDWYDQAETEISAVLANLSDQSFKHLQTKDGFGHIASPKDSQCYPLLFAKTFLDETNSHRVLTALVRRAKGINLAHLALAGILKDFHRTPNDSWGHTVFTTNFDDLLLKALLALNHTARVFGELKSMDRPVLEPTYPQIVHLHGRHTGYRLANTEAQFKIVDPNLKAGFLEHVRNSHLVVLGYSGWDDMAMEALREWHKDDFLVKGLFWVPYKDEKHILDKTGEFLSKCPPQKAHIIINKERSLDADSFLLALCRAINRKDGFTPYRMGITEHAKKQHSFTLRQLQAHPDHDPLQSRNLARRAVAACLDKDFPTAMKLVSETKTRANSDLPSTARAEVYLIAGVAEMLLNQFEAARQTLSDALTLSTPDGKAPGLSPTKLPSLLALGFTHLQAARIQDAQDCFHEVKRQARQTTAISALATAQVGLATVAIRLGHADDALVRLRDAMQLVGLPDLVRAEILRLSGDCHRLLSSNGEAKECYAGAREAYKRSGDLIGEGEVLKSLGDIANRDSLDEARTHYDEAEKMFEDSGDINGKAVLQQVKGDM